MPHLLLVGVPIGAATLVFLLRRLRAGAVLAVLTVLFLAWLAVQLPPGVVLNLLGRTIELDSLSKVMLALLFGSTALLFVILIFLTAAQPTQRRALTYLRQTGQQGRFFYPAALIILGLFVAASMSRHLGITAILIELAAILMVFVIQTERLESTRASLRFIILVSLAAPLFLLAARDIDDYQLSGTIVTPENLEQIALFVGLGFAIWLAVIPFHSWMTNTAAESVPVTAAFVLIAFPIVAVSTLMHLLADLPWLVDSQYLVGAIIIAGVTTAFAGGVLAAIQRGFSEMLGYAALFNMGCIITVLGLGGPAAVVTVLVGLTVRALALILIAASLSTLNIGSASVGFSWVRGAAYTMPVATVGLIVGGLTLAGAPFTAGFPPFWQAIRPLAEVDIRGTIFLLAGALGTTAGFLRGLRALLKPPAQPVRSNGLNLRFEEPYAILVIIAMLTVITIALGVFPWLVIEPLQLFAGHVAFPIK
ncbi:MAG: NAD(P)H-quinone oxidoreductase subunit 2, chloroplastic [Anaerolineae bacterium]|nr:NAD(P)H-quinone oxidoreductase subunit 2, chloroplastic [Anaerolineae bacterium]